MNKSIFSIITCTYNSAKYLEKNIKSVMEQDFTDYEHIFIDGFSEDNTVDIINKYKEKYPGKVKLFQYPSKGISNAMNKGIEHSSGQYLIHLHADDSFYDKKVLADVENYLSDNNFPDWIYGKINVVKDGGSLGIFPKIKIWHKKENSKIKNYLLKFNNYIPHQAVFIKKEIFDKF